MIVENYGYTTSENVLKINVFCIYKTYKIKKNERRIKKQNIRL